MFLIRGIARQITRLTSGIKSPNIVLILDWKLEAFFVYQKDFRFLNVLTSDNICLTIAKSRPSEDLLIKPEKISEFRNFLSVPENVNLPSIEIEQAANFNVTDIFIEVSGCSENYIEVPVPAKTFIYDQTKNFTHEISDNLFNSFINPTTFGQVFVKIKNNTELDNESEVRKKVTQNNDRIPIRSPSLWDVLQPMLLPPLSLEFPKELDFYSDLRGYQKEGISWLVNSPSALLADEMGTGKTVQVVNSLRLLFRQGRIQSVLIVCPPAVIGSIDLSIETGRAEGWSGHFYYWASDELEVAVIRGGGQEQRKIAWNKSFHVYITTYDTLRSDIGNHITDYEKFDCVILDEAQKIKNRETKTAQSIRWLQPTYRWALTGTPIENSMDDIKSLFDFVCPGIFKGNMEHSPQRLKELIAPYMLRRLKQDVLPDLPDKIKQDDWLDLDESQRHEYQEVLQAGRKHIETSLNVREKVQTHIFALLAKLKQICNFASSKTTSPKTERLLEYVQSIIANNQKVLVFSQYRAEGIDKIARFLDSKNIPYALYVGSSEQQKNKAINDFRSDPNISVFLATIQTAGYGITLTEARYVIHFDYLWNPAKMQNAEDRTHRIGQKNSVTVYSFWMKETIEERIKKKILEKRLLIESTVDELAVNTLEDELSTEDWLDIFDIKPVIKTSENVDRSSVPSAVEKTTSARRRRSKSNSTEKSVSVLNNSNNKSTEVIPMSNDRLRTVEQNLDLLRKDIEGREKAKILAAFEEKARIELGINEQRKEMKKCEEEYWQLLAGQLNQTAINEPEAESVIAELIEQVGMLQTSTQYPDEILQLLQKIYAEVSKLGSPASAKLKGAVSMLPPFVGLSYEAEIDTENFFRTHLPTFTKWYKSLAKK